MLHHIINGVAVQIIEAHMKAVLDIIVVVAWVAMSLAAVSLLGRYRKTHAVGGPTRRDEYRADRDMVLQMIVFLIGILSVVVMYALNRMVG